MNDTILETKRLFLRYQRKGDFDFFVKLWTDEDITKYVGGPRNKNNLIDSFNELAEDPKKYEFDLWYVVLKETGELTGMAGILPKEIEGEPHYEINFFIDKNHWNRAYATEIADEVIQYHKNKKGIKTFIAIIDKDNISSIRVAEKIGMSRWKTVKRNNNEKEIYKGEY